MYIGCSLPGTSKFIEISGLKNTKRKAKHAVVMSGLTSNSSCEISSSRLLHATMGPKEAFRGSETCCVCCGGMRKYLVNVERGWRSAGENGLVQI